MKVKLADAQAAYKQREMFYPFGKGACLSAHHAKEVTVEDIRQYSFDVLVYMYNRFCKFLQGKDIPIYNDLCIINREDLLLYAELFSNQATITADRNRWGILNLLGMLDYWKWIGLFDVCGAGYQMNEVSDREPSREVARILAKYVAVCL